MAGLVSSGVGKHGFGRNGKIWTQILGYSFVVLGVLGNTLVSANIALETTREASEQ